MFGNVRLIPKSLVFSNFSRKSAVVNRFAFRSFANAVEWHGTTIICVRKDGKVAMAGDGMVSMGSIIVKPNAKKIRRIGDNILVGFAGATADALTLHDRLEKKLEEYPGQLMRACVELAKAWRTDKYLRRLEAVLLVADSQHTFELTGNGDVLEPYEGAMGIGSGGIYAQAAALACMDHPHMTAKDIARKAMKIAADICVHTNHNVLLETIEPSPSSPSPSSPSLSPSSPLSPSEEKGEEGEEVSTKNTSL